MTILSDNYFELKHEASQADMAKISNVLLSNDERAKAYNILSLFPDIRRDLARYGYYEKGTHVTASPIAAFNRENTESDLNEVSWLINKLGEIHYYYPPIRIGINISYTCHLLGYPFKKCFSA